VSKGWWSAGRPARPKKKSGLVGRLSFPNFSYGLDAFDVLCLPALGTLHYVELNLLTFLQAAKTVCLNSGEVHENVFTILAADKTIALGIVKPLYCSCFHDVTVFLLLKYALELAG
jgi:hypothetical protein